MLVGVEVVFCVEVVYCMRHVVNMLGVMWHVVEVLDMLCDMC